MTAFIALLLVFLSVNVIVIVSHRQDMLDEARRYSGREIALIGTLLREAALRGDDATVERFIAAWGVEHKEIAYLKVVTPEGHVIAEYFRKEQSREMFPIRETVTHSGRDLLRIDMLWDMAPVLVSLNKLRLRLIAGSVLMTLFLGFALWYALRRMAIKPLEGEIGRRNAAEEALRAAQRELERRVEERTVELSSANKLLTGEIIGHKAAEAALMDSEERYRKLVELSPDAIFLHSNGKCIFANTAGAKLMGASSADELMGKSVIDAVHPDYKEVVGERIRKMLEEGKSMPFIEEKFITLDGRTIDVEVAAAPVVYKDKLAVQVFVRDMTGRKKAEGERKSLIATLNTLVEHMPGGVVLLDAEGRAVHANSLGLEHLGALSEAGIGEAVGRIAGRPLDEFIVSPSLMMLHEVEAGGRSFEAAVRPLETGGKVLFMRDVTEEKALKRRIQMQEQLAAVGQLASGIAHDFNNLLTVINGYTEMLLEHDLPPEVRGHVLTVKQSGERGADLITQILDFSRRTSVELKTIDLVGFVKGFVDFIKRAIPENIHALIDYTADGYTVRADSTKLQQALTNLALNARDAMPSGGELRFGLSRLSLVPGEIPPLPDMPPGQWITLTVADTGTGITPEIIPHIFEPFFSTKGVGRGTGLGLAQVYGIVKQHGGFIDARSDPGKGSSFTLYLPFAAGEAAEAAPVEAAPSIPKGKGETILVAEDERPVLVFIGKVLSGLGYNLLAAENGSEALRLFKEPAGETRLVITDLIMPEMGGIELCKAIKGINPAVKVIALSGYPVNEEEVLKTGFDDFIKKPFQVRTLAEAVRKALGTRSHR